MAKKTKMKARGAIHKPYGAQLNRKALKKLKIKMKRRPPKKSKTQFVDFTPPPPTHVPGPFNSKPYFNNKTRRSVAAMRRFRTKPIKFSTQSYKKKKVQPQADSGSYL